MYKTFHIFTPIICRNFNATERKIFVYLVNFCRKKAITSLIKENLIRYLFVHVPA